MRKYFEEHDRLKSSSFSDKKWGVSEKYHYYNFDLNIHFESDSSFNCKRK